MSLQAKPAQYQQQLPPGVADAPDQRLPGWGPYNDQTRSRTLKGAPGLQRQQVDFLKTLLAPGGFKNLESFFGQLGSPATGLQRQATGGIEQFLNMPAPEQRALDTSMPALQAILSGSPGQGIMDALQPQFLRNLDTANQQGGRFSTGNAVLRSRALEDFNLLGANVAQQGQQTQLQASQILSALAQSAGNDPFRRLTEAFGIGQAGAGQQDLETQRRIQLMATLFGGAQGVAFNQPWTQTTPYQPGAAEQLWQGLLGAGSTYAGSKAGGG